MTKQIVSRTNQYALYIAVSAPGTASKSDLGFFDSQEVSMAPPPVVQGRVIGNAKENYAEGNQAPHPHYSTPPVVQGNVIGNADGSYPGDSQPAPGYPHYATPYPADPQAAQAPYGPYGHSGAAPSTYPAAPQHLGVFQSCKDSNLPPEIRLNFIKKVYGILGTMLLITFGISTPFIFATKATLDFFKVNVWILYIVYAIVIAQLIFNFAMSCQMCCGGSSLLQSYLWMMKTSPYNYVYLFTFAACFGVCTGFICAQYTVQSVLLVFALTFVLIVALTIYAVKTKADFTGCGAFMMVGILGLSMLFLVYMFFPGSVVLAKIISGVGATLFGFLIVYDTQQIFGSAAVDFGGGQREVEYTLDMYAFAAWNLYLDFLNFFLYLLQLFGERRWGDSWLLTVHSDWRLLTRSLRLKVFPSCDFSQVARLQSGGQHSLPFLIQNWNLVNIQRGQA